MRRQPSSLADAEYDVVVVGGGIAGAAALWEATQRGLSAALIERDDFGAATSAHSLKVVHGGIRYLQHLDVARVRESSRERAILLRIAPHLVRPMPVLVPTYGHGLRGGEALRAAFVLLEALTASRNRGLADPDRRVPRARFISPRQVREWHPELDHPGLTGAGMFWDGQLLNPQRLVWEFIRTAGSGGAQAVNHCEVTGFVRRGDRVTGVTVRDRLTDDRFAVRGRVVVNAAGPFAEQLYVRCGWRATRRVPLSRDLALVVARRPAHEHGLALQTAHRDPDALLSRGARHLFLMPWRDRTLIGVHSIIYRDDPDALAVTGPEVLGFLEEINHAAPHLGLTPADVALVLAGLLPIGEERLVRADVSFGKRPLVIDNATADGIEGLVTAVTNRYTVARGVAERAIDLVFQKLGHTPPRSRTAETPLAGGRFDGWARLAAEVRAGVPNLPAAGAEHLAQNYGSSHHDILRLARAEPRLSEPLGASAVLGAEVVLAVREEMAVTLADCVFQRTELGTAGHPGGEALVAAARLAAAELAWSAGRVAAELAAVEARFPPPSPYVQGARTL